MTTRSALAVRVHHDTSGAAVIHAAGELDLACAARLRSVLLDVVEDGTVVLDAAEISFCDSSGLRTLAEARHLARAAGHTFRLAAASPAVLRVLELAGALTLFELYPDLETALKS